MVLRCVYIYVHICIYTYTLLCVYKQQPVLKTVGPVDIVTWDWGRQGCLHQAPLCIRSSPPFTPKFLKPGRAVDKMKGCPFTPQRSLVCLLQPPVLWGCVQESQATFKFILAQPKKKKTFIINMSTQPNRLVCMLLSTNLIFKAEGKHSAVFPLTLLLLSHTYKSQNSK